MLKLAPVAFTGYSTLWHSTLLLDTLYRVPVPENPEIETLYPVEPEIETLYPEYPEIETMYPVEPEIEILYPEYPEKFIQNLIMIN